MLDADVILERIRAERGYTLSYHAIYARLDPDFLDAYAGLYRACTLRSRRLTSRQREIVWICLLSAIREDVGSIHVERAQTAGVTSEEILAAVRLSGVADAWDGLAFAHGHWDRLLGGDLNDEYGRLVRAVAEPLDADLVDLALAVAHGAHRREVPLLLHLRRLADAGVDERDVAEAVSYILQPVGANTLLWVTDRWLEGLRSGALPPSASMGTAPFETRTR